MSHFLGLLQANREIFSMLTICFEDNHFIAINKPHGLLVHRSPIAADAEEFALQKLRDQIGQEVHSCHRIDRKTSGVLLFAKSRDALKDIRVKFEAHELKKEYLAILRGYSDSEGTIDYPLKNEKGKSLEAVTNYQLIEKSELELPFGKHQTSRYSLVSAQPITGRMHQLRKHFAHILHPIIGDRPYGCNKQNKLFKEKWNITSMMLHALSLEFEHPYTNQMITIKATPQAAFMECLQTLGFSYSSK